MLWIVIGRPAFRIFWKLAAHDCMPRTRRAMLEIALWADGGRHADDWGFASRARHMRTIRQDAGDGYRG